MTGGHQRGLASPTAASPRPRVEFADLIARARDDAENIVRHLWGEPTSRKGNALLWGAHGRCKLTLTGPHAGRWSDWSGDANGDAADLIQRELNLDYLGAMRWLAEWFGDPQSLPPVDHAAREARREADRRKEAAKAKAGMDYAKAIWQQAAPITGTLAETYLRKRTGRPIPEGVIAAGWLRYHPAPFFGRERVEGAAGGMVAQMSDALTGAPLGVHRTFISARADRLERKMLGTAGVVRLFDPEQHGDALTGLALGEGIETCLGVANRYDWQPIWAALNAGKMAAFPALPHVEAITVFADNDQSGTGERAAVECAGRWLDAGREATVYQPRDLGTDFDDVATTGRAVA